MTDALVLSGGSIKGAYQAGAISALYSQGFRPGIVTGISVGALNAAYLAAYPNSPDSGEMLAAFWRGNVTSPASLIRKRGFLDLAWRTVTKRWAGAVDTDPMAKLVEETLGEHLPVKNPTVQTRVGAVNLRTGAIEYYASDHPDFLDAVIASTAEPVTMPLRKVVDDYPDSDLYYDGGLRDIAPLKQAISLGATRIVVILCQPPKLSEFTGNAGDVLSLAARVAGICADEILANDIARAEETNAAVRLLKRLQSVGRDPSDQGQSVPQSPRLAGKREIDIRVIRPKEALRVDVASFTSADIHRMVDQGYQDAQGAI